MPESSPNPSAEDRSPFKALLAAWSLVVVVLGAAGFSDRWNYYYNFGLQNLVFQVPLASLPVHAIEIVRNPENLVDLLKWVFFLLVPFEILRIALGWAGGKARNSWENYTFRNHESSFGLLPLFSPGSQLLVDAIRAGLIVYIAFYVGGLAGTRDYRANVVEQTSRLPKVAAIMVAGAADGEPRLPFICDTRPLLERRASVSPPFVGDPGIIRFLSGGAGCSSPERSWRLLFRDEKFVYLFASLPNFAVRPDTLVLPDDGKLILVMR